MSPPHHPLYHPGLIDNPGRELCDKFRAGGRRGGGGGGGGLGAYDAAGAPRARRGSPLLLFAGAVWTVGQGDGRFYEPSRLVLYRCHKNASRERDYLIVQTETQPEAVLLSDFHLAFR